ncbi:MAG: hypothetical protein K0Q72_3852 [Armatimonadetes bacterium]|nr:hypothetical protein [Armatimonadota bacterium]
MFIPEEYHGTWSGTIDDTSRRTSYPGTIELRGTGGSTRYEQKLGVGSGDLIASNVPFVFHEAYVGPKGGRKEWRLALSRNAAGELVCRWNRKNGSQFATAIFHRVTASTPAT